MSAEVINNDKNLEESLNSEFNPNVTPSPIEERYSEGFQSLIKIMNDQYFMGIEPTINATPGMRKDLLGLNYISHQALLKSEHFEPDMGPGCYVVRAQMPDGRDYILHVGKSGVDVKKQAQLYLTNKLAVYSAKGMQNLRLSVALVKAPPGNLETVYESLKKRVPFTRYLLNGDVWRKKYKQLFWNWWNRGKKVTVGDKETILERLSTQWAPVSMDQVLVQDLGENLHGDMWGYGNMPGCYVIMKDDKTTGKPIIVYVGESEVSMYERVRSFNEEHGCQFDETKLKYALIPIPKDLVMKSWSYVNQIFHLEDYLIKTLRPLINKQKIIKQESGPLFKEYENRLLKIGRDNNVRGSSYETMKAAQVRISELTGIGRNYFLLAEIETIFAGYYQYNNRRDLIKIYGSIENLYNNLGEQVFRLEHPDLFDTRDDEDDAHLNAWLQQANSFEAQVKVLEKMRSTLNT